MNINEIKKKIAEHKNNIEILNIEKTNLAENYELEKLSAVLKNIEANETIIENLEIKLKAEIIYENYKAEKAAALEAINKIEQIKNNGLSLLSKIKTASETIIKGLEGIKECYDNSRKLFINSDVLINDISEYFSDRSEVYKSMKNINENFEKNIEMLKNYQTRTEAEMITAIDKKYNIQKGEL